MTPIESGTTLDQRIRTGIFLLMCVGMAAWFGYDGLIGYPAQNLSWAGDKLRVSQNLPQRPENLKTNSRATKKNLSAASWDKGVTVDQIRQQLGDPFQEMPRTLTYIGTEVTLAIGIDGQGKVTTVRISPTGAGVDEKKTGVLVTRARSELVKEGMTEEAVRQLLGEPASARDHTLWYIGPATYAEFRIVGGKVAAKPDVQENEHRSEGSILLQRVISVGVALVALYGLMKFWSAVRTRVVVDDAGMVYNGRHISWDSMLRLRTEQYKEKAWVDLEYREGASERSLRLDAMLIQRFPEIMRVVCERKGFVLPTRASDQDESHDATAS